MEAPAPHGDAVPQEVELKLHVPTAVAAALWAHPSLSGEAAGPLRVARLDNRYFDTPDRALAAAGLGLRLRRSGRLWLQTLKVAGTDDGALSARGEWEMPVAGPTLELARLSATPLAAIASMRALRTRLHPVFTTSFRREARLVRLDDGSTVEVAFDVGEIVAGRGASRRSLPIRELEIETKQPASDGTAPDLLRFAARLARDLALVPLAASKAARGYRLLDGRPLEPATVRLPDARADTPPRAHLGRVLAAGQRALSIDTHALMESRPPGEEGDDRDLDAVVDFVHQARVAIRRMRSALRTFRPVADGKRFALVDAQLRSVGQVFGHARDWDVLVASGLKRIAGDVASDAEGRAALALVTAQARVRRRDAHRVLSTYLETREFGATMIAVERLVRRLADEPAGARGAVLGERASRWLSTQRERVVSRARRIAVLDVEQRHGLRIEVKRLRYALDLLETLYDAPWVDAFREALADLQDKLGKLNDTVVGDALLRTLPASPERDLVLGRLAAGIDHYVRKQLPKVGALAVAFELTPVPWHAAPAPAR